MESTAHRCDPARVTKPAATAIEKFDTAYDLIHRDQGRPPTLRELAETLGITRERARQVVRLRSAQLKREIKITVKRARRDADGDLRKDGRKLIGRRCKVGVLPDELGPTERIVVANMQRVYASIIASPDAPSDAKLAARAGYKDRPDKAANEFRRYIEGLRVPTIERLGKIAAALGVHVGELLRPL